ncbi:hypothetical protein ACSFA8_24000 [Variovorax sp. RT4R15]|uniref:hypothetical protein n=1 Tax=Variovorax sp. RT4R15 TaxID=3443737 RepID=UPI003F44B23D
MTLEQFANFAGAAGTCALAWPSFAAARLVWQLKRGQGIATSIPQDQDRLRQWASDANNTIDQIRNAWKTREAIALFGGLALTFLSYALPLARQMGWV